jgi:hypothetical protein
MSAPADTRASLLVWACLLVLLATAAAQGPAGSSWSMGRGRLFVLDNSPAAPSVLALDLPSLNVSARLAMPGTSLQLGVTQDGDFLGVFRNRDNDQQVQAGPGFASPVPSMPSEQPALTKHTQALPLDEIFDGNLCVPIAPICSSSPSSTQASVRSCP